MKNLKFKRGLALIFVTIICLGSFAFADSRDTAGDSKLLKLRKPKYEFRESKEALEEVLPDYAKQELLVFEEKLLEPEKPIKTGH
jgi:hypothetical protein